MPGLEEIVVFREQIPRGIEEKELRIEVVVVDVEGDALAPLGGEAEVVERAVARAGNRGAGGLGGNVDAFAILNGYVEVGAETVAIDKLCREEAVVESFDDGFDDGGNARGVQGIGVARVDGGCRKRRPGCCRS